MSLRNWSSGAMTMLATVFLVSAATLAPIAAHAADNQATGDIAGNAANLGSSNTFTINSSQLALVKTAFLTDGTPIATLVNWANHPETLGSKNTLITADYPGYLCREAEKRLGGITVFVNGAVGGMQSPLGSTVKDASGKVVPERTYEKAEFIGSRVAELAAGALAAAPVATPDAFLFREKPIEVPMTNPIFRMAAQAGIFAGRKQPNAEGGTTSPVGFIRFTRAGRPQLEIALVPGELYPEISVGGVERYSGADFPDAAVEPAVKQQMTAPFRMLFGLADDEVGYIIPKCEWDEKPPYLNGSPKPHYGEVNSLGPETAPRITNALREMLAGK